MADHTSPPPALAAPLELSASARALGVYGLVNAILALAYQHYEEDISSLLPLRRLDKLWKGVVDEHAVRLVRADYRYSVPYSARLA